MREREREGAAFKAPSPLVLMSWTPSRGDPDGVLGSEQCGQGSWPRDSRQPWEVTEDDQEHPRSEAQSKDGLCEEPQGGDEELGRTPSHFKG